MCESCPISSVHIDCSTLTIDGFQRNRVCGGAERRPVACCCDYDFCQNSVYLLANREKHFSVKKIYCSMDLDYSYFGFGWCQINMCVPVLTRRWASEGRTSVAYGPNSLRPYTGPL